MGKKRIGDVLIERGALRQGELDRALSIQREKSGRLGEILMQNLLISKAEVASAIEEVQGVPYVECPPQMVTPDTLALLPRAVAVQCCAMPIEVRNNSLIVAMAEPQNLKLVEELHFRAGKTISPRFSFKEDILASIRRFYDKEEVVRELVLKPIKTTVDDDFLKTDAEEEATLTQLEFIVASSREENREAMKELRAGVKKQTLVLRFLSLILARAASKQASDVHIEPCAGESIVRIRMDGMLYELLKVPVSHQSQITSRIKTLADMDTAEQRLPQEGRFLMVYMERKLDVRVSTLPTSFGEKIVLRILDPGAKLTAFEQLGLSQQQVESLGRVLELPQGLLIVTGPTGSGKSTTLYALLNSVSLPGRNVVTVEDPIEYTLQGVTQMQISPHSGLTVANCLRPILRQNPSVLMVGEIWDSESAETVFRASQTCQLVLTTLRTKDSVGALTRLHGLGIPPALLASVSCIIGQRLVRRLCPCRKEVAATESYLRSMESLGWKKPLANMYQPIGCSSCEGTGYKGRIGIYEVLNMNRMVRNAIHAQVPEEEIRTILRSTGFHTMQEDALEKVVQGITTLDEMRRVVPVDTNPEMYTCRDCRGPVSAEFNFCPFCGLSVKDIEKTVPTAVET